MKFVQERLRLLQRGILAFSAEIEGASEELKRTRAKCALDFWLRMMWLLSEVDPHGVKAWLDALINASAEVPAGVVPFEGKRFGNPPHLMTEEKTERFVVAYQRSCVLLGYTDCSFHFAGLF